MLKPGGAACAYHTAIAQGIVALQMYGISPSTAQYAPIKGRNRTNVPYLSSLVVMACPPYVTENCAYIVRVRNMVDQSQPECPVS